MIYIYRCPLGAQSKTGGGGDEDEEIRTNILVIHYALVFPVKFMVALSIVWFS